MAHLWNSGFSVRQPAWHGLADVLDDYPKNWADARTAAGLDWDVVDRPLPLITWDDHGRPQIVTDPSGIPVIDPDWKAVIRSDTGYRLAYARDSYTVISMEDFGMIFESVIDTPNVKFETAGSLDEGRMVWALAYLDEPIRIGGDNSETIPYLLLLSKNDGTGAAQLIPTSVRVICANTAKAAEWEGERHGAVYSFKHTKRWRERVADAREAVGFARDSFARWRTIAEGLYDLPVSAAGFDWFIDQFLPYPPEGHITPKVRRNIDSARDRVRLLAHEVTNRDILHNAYGLVQIGTEYLDHTRSFKTKASYFNRTMIKPERQKAHLVTLARQAAEVV